MIIMIKSERLKVAHDEGPKSIKISSSLLMTICDNMWDGRTDGLTYGLTYGRTYGRTD